MTITNNNLYSESYTILKNFINTNLTDPRNRFKKQWVHASLPDLTNKGFDGYPFVVINMGLNEDEHSFDLNISDKTFRITLSIYSNEPTEVDTLADELVNKFRTKTLTNNLNEFKAKSVTASPLSTSIINGLKIYSRIVNFRGHKRI
jgi:hypothetical protein